MDSKLAKLVNYIVGIAGVTYGVGASKKHLERDVGHQLPHRLESLPGTLMKKPHSHIESSSTPVLHGVQR